MKQIQSSPQLKKLSAPSLTERAGGESVQNNQACFVWLWRKLERTRCLLGGQYKRFCIRNVLKIVAVRLGISFYKIDLKALDKAYSEAYPNSTPINKNKKKIRN